MKYNIFLTAILIFCLSVLPCSAEFKGNIVQTGVVNGIQTGDDGKVNSLGVNYDASGEAGTITLDKIEAGDLTEPVVIKTNSSSTSTKVLEVQDESGVTLVEVNADGSVKTAELQPLDSTSANVMRLPSGSTSPDSLVVQDNTGTRVFKIADDGVVYGYNDIFFGTRLSFDYSESVLGVDGTVEAGVISPYSSTSDLKLRLRDDTKKFAFQNSSGSDVASIGYEGSTTVTALYLPDSDTSGKASIFSDGNRILHTYGDTSLFIGYDSGNPLNTGILNFGFGNRALEDVTDGRYNVAYGSGSLRELTSGQLDCGVGYDALKNTDGNKITGIGSYALINHRTGESMVGIGETSGDNITSGSYGVFVGAKCQSGNPTNTQNEIVIGYATDGNGNNTATIGNDNITDTYLKGVVHTSKAFSFPEVTAPSAPSSGGTMYFDSTAQELRFKDDSGNVYSIDLTPVP